MDIRIEVDGPYQIAGHLRDGTVETTVTGANAVASALALVGALQRAKVDGHAECFWHEATGQYWWMLQCDERTLELAVMWSSGTVTGWQHVFRAADDVNYVIERVRDEMDRNGIDLPAIP